MPTANEGHQDWEEEPKGVSGTEGGCKGQRGLGEKQVFNSSVAGRAGSGYLGVSGMDPTSDYVLSSEGQLLAGANLRPSRSPQCGELRGREAAGALA